MPTHTRTLKPSGDRQVSTLPNRQITCSERNIDTDQSISRTTFMMVVMMINAHISTEHKACTRVLVKHVLPAKSFIASADEK